MSAIRSIQVSVAFLVIFSFLCLAVLLCASCTAQVQDVNDSTATPVGGVGHDYIGMLNETVNPATGSLSVRIHLPIPKGRKLSMPFAFAYDSAAAWHLSVGSTQGPPPANPPGGWSYNTSNIGLMAYDGWSAAVPQLTAQEYKWVPNHPVTDGSVACDVMASFVFADPAGGMHQLKLVNIVNSGAQACQQVPAFETDTGGDGIYQATIGLGDVRVASPDGTVYNFPYGGIGNCPSGNGAFCELPSWIEDRNGNVLTVGGSGGSPSVTDDAGRAALTVSNFLGAGGQSGSGSVSVSGLANPYTINWEGIPATGFGISVTSLHSGDSYCLAPPKLVGLVEPPAGKLGGGGRSKHRATQWNF